MHRATRKSRKICLNCLRRRALFCFRGRVKRDNHHTICFGCYRNQNNQLREIRNINNFYIEGG